MVGMEIKMDGLKFGNILISIISLVLSYLIIKNIKINKLILAVIIFISLGIITIFIDMNNEIIQIIMGTIFGTTLIVLYEEYINKKND